MDVIVKYSNLLEHMEQSDLDAPWFSEIITELFTSGGDVPHVLQFMADSEMIDYDLENASDLITDLIVNIEQTDENFPWHVFGNRDLDVSVEIFDPDHLRFKIYEATPGICNSP